MLSQQTLGWAITADCSRFRFKRARIYSAIAGGNCAASGELFALRGEGVHGRTWVLPAEATRPVAGLSDADQALEVQKVWADGVSTTGLPAAQPALSTAGDRGGVSAAVRDDGKLGGDPGRIGRGRLSGFANDTALVQFVWGADRTLVEGGTGMAGAARQPFGLARCPGRSIASQQSRASAVGSERTPVGLG